MDARAHAAKYPLPARIIARINDIEKADDVVDIRDILKQMGRWAPSGDFYSYKIDCPWNYEHADGGLDKNCRIFGGTNIYCWAMHGYLAPTTLYSKWKGISRQKAAEILLDERGLLRKPWREKWNELIDVREAAQSRGLGSKTDMVAALHTKLATYPEYVDNEFHPSVRKKWEKVLVAIDRMWERDTTSLTDLEKLFDLSLTALVETARMVADYAEET